MQFRILGPLEVTHDGRTLELGYAKQQMLLGALLLDANRVVGTARLIDELWGEAPPASAPKLVQGYVSGLRKVLGHDTIFTRAGGYVVRVEPDRLDASRFDELAAAGRACRSDPETAAQLFGDALALWRGGPLEGLAFEATARHELERLAEQRMIVLEQRIDADLARGRHAELVGELSALVAHHPFRERLQGQLMLALYRSGRQADALETYRRARGLLVDALGIEPGHELRELQQAILGQDPRLDFAAAEPAVGALGGAFVGRAVELSELSARLGDALAGRGRLCLVGGEPGIGKSRLAEELVALARARGARVLVGRCWEAGGAPAYWPWVQSLRGYVRDTDTDALRSQLGAGAAEVAQLVPELRGRLADLPEPLSLGSEGARFRLFDATTEFLRKASERRPIVLVLDDLHAADAPSLLLLRFLARELGSIRMLVLGAYRDVDPRPGQPLTELLAAAASDPVTRRLMLGGLSEHEIAQYVDQTASQIASAQLVAALHEQTQGNPLFVGEIVRLLTSERVRSASTAEPRVAVPESVRDVIARRLAHLASECNRVLVLASVLGREFALAPLARLGGVSEEQLFELLDEAISERVVADLPAGTGRLRFAHVLIRDTLYDGLTSARRVRLHRQAMETLETLYGDDLGPHLSELAHHATAGRDFDKGVGYARRAADRALALPAYEEAARLYLTALEALGFLTSADEPERCELLLSLGDAHTRAGNTSVAKQTFLDAAAIAQRLGLARQHARAAAGYAGRIVWDRVGDDDRLVPLLEAGLAALADKDVELRARLLARLAGALRDEPSRDRRDRLSGEAIELARRTGNAAALAYALDGRAAAIVAPDTMTECLALGTELRDLAARIGDTERLMAGHAHRIIAHITVGDVREAEADLAAGSRIADQLRQPAQLWLFRANRALLTLTAGRIDEAERLIAQAFALGEHVQPAMATPTYQLQRYALCDLRERLEDVEPAIHELVIEYPARPFLRCVLVQLQARLGRTAEAKRSLANLAQDEFSALPFDQEWLYGISLLAETSALLQDTDTSEVLYRLLLPWAAFNTADVPEGIRGSVSRYLGILATTTNRWKDAEAHFEDALSMNERMGARPWLAHTQHEYARMLLACDQPRHPEHAQELLHAALAAYRDLDMDAQAARASALARKVGTPA